MLIGCFAGLFVVVIGASWLVPLLLDVGCCELVCCAVVIVCYSVFGLLPNVLGFVWRLVVCFGRFGLLLVCLVLFHLFGARGLFVLVFAAWVVSVGAMGWG